MTGSDLGYLDNSFGMSGIWLSADAGGRPLAACVVLGGSEGGSETAGYIGEAFKAAGVSALALAYHGEGTPRPTLREVPLDGIAQAVRWAAARTGLPASEVAVLGLSRGSEAAMLVSALVDDVADRVVGIVAGNLVGASWPPAWPAAPGWVLSGKSLPFAIHEGPTCADPQAIIPVERIPSLLLVSAGRDEIWPSGPMSDAIVRRRAEHGLRTKHIHVARGTHRVLDLPARGGTPRPGTPWAAILEHVRGVASEH